MELNKTIHQTDENGDPVRNDDGAIRLKTNWKDLAVDHKGRKYNALLHGDRLELDDSGLIKMRRRDAARKPMGATNKTETFVKSYRENGYAYRVVNDDPGRIETFKQHDWEPVMAKDGVATMEMGQGRRPGTKGILMRKPEEWFEADQKEKDRLLNVNLESKTKPKPSEGQYGEGLKVDSPLR